MPGLSDLVHGHQEGPAGRRQDSATGRPRRPGAEETHHVGALDGVWLTDITEDPTAEGKLYCGAVMNLFSNRIGHSLFDRMTADLATSAQRSAATRRHRGRPLGQRVAISITILPSRPQANHLTVSIRRVASVDDNAAIESFHNIESTKESNE